MKLILIVFILFSISFNSLAQHGIKYFSYPDKVLELLISDKYVLLRNTTIVNMVVEKPDTLHFIKKGDTLFINEKTKIGNKNQILIKKGKYIDYIIYNSSEYLESICCGYVFKKDNSFFNHKKRQIVRTTNRETYNRILELHNRLIRLEIFNKGCDEPLPPLYYENL